ncbi:uncharacterized protein LOC125284270 isoform X1 [Alosa alosa]|uniref:uncharacterized protein LOC125284270 isoform X1 n=1 Tax=Alosa alosa TaxID=278164 RepID=UPI0020154C52|nr:uncharacterized protein LOC125284270 isoform X1 [Alosa alosa]
MFGRVTLTVAIGAFLLFYTLASQKQQWSRKDKREVVSTEIPAEYIDPASIDLTPLVNTLINTTNTGSQHLFSLLTVTSHSSLALHKLTLLLYNISNFRDIADQFPMRYCYCVTNQTNDLTDFTAVLLDVMGNSTSYLQELFKSSSILSVNQKNSSDCIYICVMAGKSEKDLNELWNLDLITPLFNQTITEDTHREATLASLHIRTTTATTTTTKSSHIEKPGCPWRVELTLREDLKEISLSQDMPREDLKENSLSVGKLQPCVFELCKFYNQCLCRAHTHSRFCEDSLGWYEKHTHEICTRVRRVAFSRSLKQRCLSRMCVKKQ